MCQSGLRTSGRSRGRSMAWVPQARTLGLDLILSLVFFCALICALGLVFALGLVCAGSRDNRMGSISARWSMKFYPRRDARKQ